MNTAAAQFWSLPEVAARLGISLRGLRRLIDDGQIAVLPIRGRVTITEAALERFVAEHEQIIVPNDARPSGTLAASLRRPGEGPHGGLGTDVMALTLDRPSLDRP